MSRIRNALYTVQDNPLIVIASRECTSLLKSPLGSLLVLCWSILLCYLYQGALDRFWHMSHMSPYTITPLAAFFHSHALGIALLVVIPTITMKLLAEEKTCGTYELILTYPIREWHLVVGKFIGACLYYVLLWCPSLWHIFLISYIGNLDWGQVVVTYVFLSIGGAGLLAIGLCVSCMFRSQLACFITTFTLLLPFVGYVFLEERTSIIASVFSPLFLDVHLQKATRGIVDLSSLCLLLSITVLALFIAVKIIEAERWFPLSIKATSRQHRHVCLLVICWLLCSFIILWYQGASCQDLLIIILLMMSFLLWIARIYQQGNFGTIVFAANVSVSILSFIIIVVIANYFAYYHRYYQDCSTSQAFSLNPGVASLLRRKLPPGEKVELLILLGFSKQVQHEHMERDNERYYILQEVLRKIATGLNEPGANRFRYRFIHPVAMAKDVSARIQQQRAHHAQISYLRNKYGVNGYRELIFLHRDRYYVVSDAQLFSRKLQRMQVPKLMLLWRKIYESGGIIEAPPDDEERAFQKLKQMANPEMLSIFPAPNLEEVLVNAIINVIDGNCHHVCFTQGKGEKWITGSVANDYQTAYRLANRLRRENFRIHALDFAKIHTLPECDVVVVLGTNAHMPFTDKEITLLDQFLHGGGNALIFLSADTDARLSPLLRKYGIHTEPNIATQYSFVGEQRTAQEHTTIGVESLGHPQLEKLVYQQQTEENAQQLIHFVVTRARLVEAVSILPEGIKVKNILHVSPRVFAAPIGNGTDSSRLGPYSIGAIAESTTSHGWKLAVIGNAIFCSDFPFYPPGETQSIAHVLLESNRFLVPALLKYMSKPEQTISVTSNIPIHFNPTAYNITARHFFLWSNLLIILLIAVVGAYIWYRNI